MTFPHALRSPVFLTSLAVLLLNDFYLKAQFGNWVTGKLSDFAGLFAFAYFWSAVFPRHGRAVHVATGVAFVIWKSPLSEPVIDAWNTLSPLHVGRVTDVTDLMALAVLPVSYWMHQRILSTPVRVPSFATLAQVIAIAAISLFAFVATSYDHSRSFGGEVTEPVVYDVNGTRDQVIVSINDLIPFAPFMGIELMQVEPSRFRISYLSQVCKGFRTQTDFLLTETEEGRSTVELLVIAPWGCRDADPACLEERNNSGLLGFILNAPPLPRHECLRDEFEEFVVEPIRSKLQT